MTSSSGNEIKAITPSQHFWRSNVNFITRPTKGAQSDRKHFNNCHKIFTKKGHLKFKSIQQRHNMHSHQQPPWKRCICVCVRVCVCLCVELWAWCCLFRHHSTKVPHWLQHQSELKTLGFLSYFPDGQADRYTGRQTSRLTGLQTGRQTGCLLTEGFSSRSATCG